MLTTPVKDNRGVSPSHLGYCLRYPTPHPSDSYLPAIFHPPSLDEADAYITHSCELVDGLKSLVHRLGQLVGKVLVVEDAHVAACRKSRANLVYGISVFSRNIA